MGQEAVQERTAASEEKWMDDGSHAGAQGARDHRVLHGEPRSPGSGALQAGQRTLQLMIWLDLSRATWRLRPHRDLFVATGAAQNNPNSTLVDISTPSSPALQGRAGSMLTQSSFELVKFIYVNCPIEAK